eukprot:ANDGO_02593.mRNA.1 Cilia- and flagella-associated protein 52
MAATGSIDLERAVGFNGLIPSGLSVRRPPSSDLIYAAGGCIVVQSTSETSDSQQTFLRGHDSDVSAITLSSSGRLLASGQRGLDSDIVIWDVDARRAAYRLEEHDHGISCLAFSPDEKLCFSSGVVADKKLIVWDLASGNMVSTISNQFQPVNVMSCGGKERDIKRRPTHKYVFATGGPGLLILWTLDPHTGECTFDRINTGHAARDFTCLLFSEDGEYLYAGTSSGDFCCVNIKNRLSNSFIPVCSGGVFSIAGISDMEGFTTRIVCGGGDGSITVFQGDKAQWVSSKRVTVQGPVTSIAVQSPQLIYAGTRSGNVYKIAVPPQGAASVTATLSESHEGVVADASFMKGVSDRVATCSADGTMRLWDLNTFKAQFVTSYRSVPGIGAPCAGVFVGELMISGWQDGKIRGADSLDGQHLWQIDNAHRGGVSCIAASHNNRFFTSGGAEGEVRVWEVSGRKMVVHLKEHTSRVAACTVFDDDAHLLTASRDKSFLCWDLRREKRVASFSQKMGGINDVALANDQCTVITVGSEKRVTYWDLRQADPVRSLEYSAGADHEASTVSLSHDNRFFATGGTDQVVRLWDTRTGRVLNEGPGHSGTICRVRFSPDDRQLVSVGSDGCMFVWNVWNE